MISNRQSNFLQDGLRRQGYSSVSEYFESEHWLKLVARYCASERQQTCAVCSASNAKVRHRTFNRIGKENLNDLVALCDQHYGQILRDPDLDMYDGYKRLRARSR